jgi:pyruvate kinase
MFHARPVPASIFEYNNIAKTRKRPIQKMMRRENMIRKAKIVCTLGPASAEESVLSRMILAGMDVARLNFSHGNHEQHAAYIQAIRRLSDELDKPVTILQDLQGPKLRVGELPEEGLQLQAGQTVILTRATQPGGGAYFQDKVSW